MTHTCTILIGFFTLFLCFSYKEEVKEPAAASVVVEAAVVNKVVEDTTLLSEEKIAGSLYEKIKIIPELHAFQQGIKGTELQEFLQHKRGPFTVFALSDNLFKFQGVDSLRTQAVNDSVVALLNDLISHKKSTSIDLIRQLKTRKVLSLPSFSEENIEISRYNFDIFITSGTIKKGRLGKTDIEASNGILHIVDSVWSE